MTLSRRNLLLGLAAAPVVGLLEAAPESSPVPYVRCQDIFIRSGERTIHVRKIGAEIMQIEDATDFVVWLNPDAAWQANETLIDRASQTAALEHFKRGTPSEIVPWVKNPENYR